MQGHQEMSLEVRIKSLWLWRDQLFGEVQSYRGNNEVNFLKLNNMKKAIRT